MFTLLILLILYPTQDTLTFMLEPVPPGPIQSLPHHKTFPNHLILSVIYFLLPV